MWRRQVDRRAILHRTSSAPFPSARPVRTGSRALPLMGRPVLCLPHARRGSRHRVGGEGRSHRAKAMVRLVQRVAVDATAQRRSSAKARTSAAGCVLHVSRARRKQQLRARLRARLRKCVRTALLHHDAAPRRHAPTSCICVPGDPNGRRRVGRGKCLRRAQGNRLNPSPAKHVDDLPA